MPNQKGFTMNPYGMTAKNHWQTWLPNRYSKLDDPDSFFSALGEEIQQRVEELTDSMAGDDPAGETYPQKLGRLNMAKQNAESQALQELALLEPEPTPRP
jgi:hypothetical protein